MEYLGEKICLIILDLWSKVDNIIKYIHSVNTDTPSYLQRVPGKVLQGSNKDGKDKYMEACLHKRRQISTFCAVDGFMALEVEAKFKIPVSRIDVSWRKPYSRTWG